MTPGIHKDVPAEQYHAWPGASASRLKTLARSPAHLRHEMDHPGEPTAAQGFGTELHCAVLEPDVFARTYVAAGSCSATTGKGEPCRNGGILRSAGEWFCGVHGKGKPAEPLQVVEARDLARYRGMADAIFAHPAGRLLLGSRTHTELSVVWDDPASGVRCKMRADALCEIDGTIVLPDLKTTEDASEDGFWRAVGDYRYDLSGCHYLHGLATVGIAVDVVVLLMVEKKPPHAVGAYEIPTAVIAAQEEPRAELLARWRECERTGAWPAFADEIVTPDVPGWFARKRGMNQLAY